MPESNTPYVPTWSALERLRANADRHPEYLDIIAQAIDDPDPTKAKVRAEELLSGPKDAHINALKTNDTPEVRQAFDMVYGRGAAEAIHPKDGHWYDVGPQWSSVGGAVQAVGDAIASGPESILHGVVKGAINTAKIIPDGTSFTAPEFLGGGTYVIDHAKGDHLLKTLDEASSIATKGNPAAKAVSAVNEIGGEFAGVGPVSEGLVALGVAKKFAPTIAMSLVSAGVIDPQEKNLTSTLLGDSENPILKGINLIAGTNPNDSQYLNRLRNGIEMMAMSVGIEKAVGVAGEYLKRATDKFSLGQETELSKALKILRAAEGGVKGDGLEITREEAAKILGIDLYTKDQIDIGITVAAENKGVVDLAALRARTGLSRGDTEILARKLAEDGHVFGTVNTELPSHLAGAKPRAAFGDKKFEVEFESDIEKALYITAQPPSRASKRDAEYRDWLKALGYTDQEIADGGKAVKAHIKQLSKNGKDGDVLSVPAIADRKSYVPASTERPASVSPEVSPVAASPEATQATQQVIHDVSPVPSAAAAAPELPSRTVTGSDVSQVITDEVNRQVSEGTARASVIPDAEIARAYEAQATAKAEEMSKMGIFPEQPSTVTSDKYFMSLLQDGLDRTALGSQKMGMTFEQIKGKLQPMVEGILKALDEGKTDGFLQSIKLLEEDSTLVGPALNTVIESLDKARTIRREIISSLYRTDPESQVLKAAEAQYREVLAKALEVNRMRAEVGSKLGMNLKSLQYEGLPDDAISKQFVENLTKEERLAAEVDAAIESATALVEDAKADAVKSGIKPKEAVKAAKVKGKQLIGLTELKALNELGVRADLAEAYVEEYLRSIEIGGKSAFNPQRHLSAVSKVLEVANEYRANMGLLSGVGTMEINALSGLITAPLSPLIEGLGGAPKRILPQYMGMLQSIPDAYTFAKRAYVDGHTVLNRTQGSMEYATAVAEPGNIRKAIQVIGKTLLFTDEFFKHIIHQGVVRADAVELAVQQGLKGAEKKAFISKMTDQAITREGALVGKSNNLKAVDVADRRTFTKDFSPNSDYTGERFLGVMQQGLSKSPLAQILITNFFRTPMRLFEGGFRYIPGLNFAVSARFRADLTGSNGAIAEAMARGQLFAGLGVLYPLVMLADAGYMTGSTEADPKMKSVIVLPDGRKWDFSQMQPFSMYMTAVADAVAESKRFALQQSSWRYTSQTEKFTEMGKGFLLGIIQAMNDTPAAQGMTKFVGFLKGMETVVKEDAPNKLDPLWKALGREAASWVPAAVRNTVANVPENYAASYGPSTDGNTFIGELWRNIVPMRNDPMRDPFLGKPTPYDRGWLKEYLFPQKAANTSPAYLEMRRAEEASGIKLQIDKPWSIKFGGLDLSGNDFSKINAVDGKSTLYDRFLEKYNTIRLEAAGGKTLEETLNSVVSSPAYSQWGYGNDKKPGQRVEILKTYRDLYHDAAMAAVINENYNVIPMHVRNLIRTTNAAKSTAPSPNQRLEFFKPKE